MSSKDVSCLVAISDKKLKQRGAVLTTSKQPKGEYLYQCGYKGCSSVVKRMGQHLRQAHHMTDKDKIKQAKTKFIRLGMPAKRQVGEQTTIQTKIVRKRKASSSAQEPPQKAASKKRKKDDRIEPEKSESTKSKASSTTQDSSRKTKPPSQKTKEEDDSITSDSDSDSDGSFVPSEHSEDSEEDSESDRGELQVEEDLDEMSSMADTDEEDDEYYAKDDASWEAWYTAKERHSGTAREHFLASFLQYLRHAEGGILSDEQSRIHVRQVHKVLEVLDKDGKDVKCLTWKRGLVVWDDFCAPNLRAKSLTGNTIKTYLKSIEIFSRFIEKGDFYNPALLTDLQKDVLVRLQPRMQDYRKAVHRRTAVQTTTRDVDESYSAMTPQDLKKFEESDLAKQAVKLIGQSLEHHLLSKKEFTLVRDYLLITVLIENGSRPGPLENAKVKRFQQATYTKSKGRWTLVVDEHKTTRH